MRTGRRLRRSASGELPSEAPSSRSSGSSTATLRRRSGRRETSRRNGTAARSCTGESSGVWDSRPSLLQTSLCNLLCRKNYEESMMVRLSLPKRAKTGRKRGLLSMSTQLSGITHFGDITALTGGEVSCRSRSTPAGPAPPPGSVLHTAPSSSAPVSVAGRNLSTPQKEESHEEEHQEERSGLSDVPSDLL